jgi:hypothetical protein
LCFPERSWVEVVELTNDTLPLVLPPDTGANTTLTATFWPDVSVSGRDGPRRLNPCPATIAWETVKSDLLELLRISDWAVAVPACTLPKLRLAELTESWL